MAVFLVGMAPAIAAGGTIYVDADVSPGGDGASWGTAYKYLQDALAAAVDGNDIWVAAGTYKPTTGSYRWATFQLINGVAIYGGFAGGEISLGERNWETNETILSGDIGVVGNNADNSYHVIYNPQGTTLDSSAILDGFTITGGNGYGGSPAMGGGMLNYGVSNYPCSPTVINCTFRDNLAGFGGGMGNFSYSSPTVINCVFYNNTTIPGGSGGGGMYNGIYSEPIVTNCTFYGNSAVFGGGIYSEGLSPPVVTNCILWADSATSSGDEIYHTPDSSPVVTYCDVQGGTGQSWFGESCIDDDPCFADAATGDFHLLSESPCINAGNNSASSLPPNDFEGDERILDSTVDMGVDEVIPPYKLTTSTDPEQTGTIALTPPGGDYLAGTEVTVTANAATGYAFDHWSGDLAGSTNPDSIIMNANKTVTAHFVPKFVLTGNGTAENPYQILDAIDVDTLGANPAYYSSHFIMKADINMSGVEYTKAVIAPDIDLAVNFQGTKFTGVFDGNNCVIRNLTIDTAGVNEDYLGLFGYISGGVVKNLGNEVAQITGGSDSWAVGGLAGYMGYGTISNCYSIGTVSGDSGVGGLVGCGGGLITNCHSSGMVSANKMPGGVMGYNGGEISSCYSTCVVWGQEWPGGLVGRNQGYKIENCYSAGWVYGEDVVGGLVGLNDASIYQSYSAAGVSGNTRVGGLAGWNRSYISYCYWDKWTSLQSAAVGYGYSSGEGKTTVEMKQEGTYTGWDFVDTWYIVEDAIYPILTWQRTPFKGDLNLDGVTNFYDLAIMANHWLQGTEPE